MREQIVSAVLPELATSVVCGFRQLLRHNRELSEEMIFASHRTLSRRQGMFEYVFVLDINQGYIYIYIYIYEREREREGEK